MPQDTHLPGGAGSQRNGSRGGGWPRLFFLVFNGHRFEIFGFEDLPAIQTFNVVDAVPARDHLRSLVVTGGLHKKETEIRPILMIQNGLSRE